MLSPQNVSAESPLFTELTAAEAVAVDGGGWTDFIDVALTTLGTAIGILAGGPVGGVVGGGAGHTVGTLIKQF
jgi:hypothetical protein